MTASIHSEQVCVEFALISGAQPHQKGLRFPVPIVACTTSAMRAASAHVSVLQDLNDWRNLNLVHRVEFDTLLDFSD
jgi:hypothetical protein